MTVKSIPQSHIGKQFGRLTVTGLGRFQRRQFLKCRCECGNETEVPGYKLTSGHSKSCGCLSVDTFRTRVTKHGLHGTPEYFVWKGMHQRCEYPKHISFKHYGARGVKVCDRWSDFSNFLADMGERPSPKHTLDRTDNDGNYEPANCRWATRTENLRHNSRSRFLTHNGQTMTLVEWSEKIGITIGALHNRLSRGWTVQEALTIVYSR